MTKWNICAFLHAVNSNSAPANIWRSVWLFQHCLVISVCVFHFAMAVVWAWSLESGWNLPDRQDAIGTQTRSIGRNHQIHFNKIIILLFQKANNHEKEKLKNIFSKNNRDENDLSYSLVLIKKYDVIKACYQKAQHYINLASNSLSVFNDCEEKNILENLTSFTLSRNF